MFRPILCLGLSIPTVRLWVVADRIGEKIAGLLGITDSRFQYAIDEYERLERLVCILSP